MTKRIITLFLAFAFSLQMFSQSNTLYYQYDADFWNPADTIIYGKFTIYGDYIQLPQFRVVNIAPLIVVKEVTHSFSIVTTFLTNLNGLQNLKKVGNGIIILGNDSISDISILHGVQSTFLSISDNKTLYFNNLDSFITSKIYINNMPSIQHFNRSTSAYYDTLSMLKCSNLQSITVHFNNDSLCDITISENPELTHIHFVFDSTSAFMPTSIAEFESITRQITIRNNPKLRSITADNDYIGYTKFTILNNPQLEELCAFDKSIRRLNDLRMPDGATWINFRDNRLSLNAFPYDNYANAILNDCSHITSIETQTYNAVQKLVVYPNPCKACNLQLKGVEPGSNVSIYSIQGQVVYSDVYKGDVLNLSNLPKSLYIVSIADLQGAKQFVKFIVE
jgi:hypothetical protein